MAYSCNPYGYSLLQLQANHLCIGEGAAAAAAVLAAAEKDLCFTAGSRRVGEAAILLHPPSPFSRCFNMDGEGVSVK